jgi:CRISPR-associated endonuclease/helicase Cas3
MPYYAHSSAKGSPPPDGWQLLSEHLRNVAEGARAMAQEMRLEGTDVGQPLYAAGLLHDLGKYRPGFQQYLRNLLSKGDPLTFHKQAGAARAWFHLKHYPIALAVMGHHGGLPDAATVKADLQQPAGQPAAEAVWMDATRDCPDLGSIDLSRPELPDPLRADLLTRVVFSCLVDADWTDTGEHDRRCRGLPEEPQPPNLEPERRLTKVLAHIDRLAKKTPEPHIKRIRAETLNACLKTAEDAPGLFSLTVPTGGGKTLASLAFALKHAARHRLRRIIYVAPYMSILEQNASVFREALDVESSDLAVFEHYSLAEPPGDEDTDETRREAAARRAESWDAPVIVTTNVQFFESLFSNKPGRCRKVHNIARSVIILDECQTLPPGLVSPTCGMLSQLACELGCTVVLCTATQPAFDHPTLRAQERLHAREIIPADLNLFARLKRVRLTWPKAGAPALSWGEVADRMLGQPSGLCVVNTKKAARAVYHELKSRKATNVFHLSTAMCPAHRREKLAAIRQLLADGASCYVVSTQLIEAGVDVDFPFFVMRELAPLESIIQAAGRCNREGRIKEQGGTVVVFRSVEGKMPPDRWYKAGRDTVLNHFLARGVEPQIDDPETIQSYFGRLYHSGSLDGEGIQAMREKLQLKQAAERYRLIKDASEPVVISKWEAHQADLDRLLDDLRHAPLKSVFRALARFQVNVFPNQIPSLADLLHKEPTSELLVWDGQYDGEVGIVEEMLDVFIV